MPITEAAATDKQIAFLNKLYAERGIADGVVPETRKEMSKTIDLVMALPKKQIASAMADLESGIYRSAKEERIYKVYKGQSGRMLAKVLMVEGGFEYRGMASRFVKADERMTLEQAKAYGAIYGVCCCCGATLTDEGSIAAGIGPVCAKKYF